MRTPASADGLAGAGLAGAGLPVAAADGTAEGAALGRNDGDEPTGEQPMAMAETTAMRSRESVGAGDAGLAAKLALRCIP